MDPDILAGLRDLAKNLHRLADVVEITTDLEQMELALELLPTLNQTAKNWLESQHLRNEMDQLQRERA